MDVGLAAYFLRITGCPGSTIKGIINENFVYLDLKKRTQYPHEIALETPAFATLGKGEIDFYVKGIKSQMTYAIEVKAGKNSSKTIDDVLEKNKADYILYAKGSTLGGRKENIITIPVYGISKFTF